jgi:hypothetical protein
MASTRRAAPYVRVSTTGRGQTIESQLEPHREPAERFGCAVVAIRRRYQRHQARTPSKTPWPEGRAKFAPCPGPLSTVLVMEEDRATCRSQ